MIAKNVTLQDLESAAAEVGLNLYDPRAKPREIRFRLALDRDTLTYQPLAQGQPRRSPCGPKYQRKSQEGRRIAAVCWHGHRDFFRALFARCPGAIIKTAMATYNGAEHFEATFEPTGDINIGSQMRPLLAREACLCGAVVDNYEGLSELA